MASQTFDQLAPHLQKVVLTAISQRQASDYSDTEFEVETAQHHSGFWVVPYLMYDFNESNYCVYPVNLMSVNSLNLGAAMAEMVAKEDSDLPAWLVVRHYEDSEIIKIIECV